MLTFDNTLFKIMHDQVMNNKALNPGLTAIGEIISTFSSPII